ncbi:ribokinase [Paenibacillus sp. NEAU-GSW1]|uniref:ribokinase n=1 Tax=Paenibacillus sp. NEAU-GSW1 TaxID=2682486 RepID=UPI0012E1BEA3|nr:ribokinase [Paenibacillus sp. NEAU-GSW1]MUT64569.1 ribokinase [Paenibacillus sp. NEAU-GSW1]
MKTPHIAVIGSLNMDIVVSISRFPVAGETLTGREAHFIPGGKGANQAVAAARLGAKTTMAGAVGGDAFGKQLLESMSRNGVDNGHIAVMDGEATGIASIMLSPEDNMIVVVPGANGKVSPESVQSFESVIAEADIVLLQLEVPLDAVAEAAQLAKKHQKLVVLNPAPAQKLPQALLDCVDVITPNRSELELLTGLKATEGRLEEAIDRLMELGPKSVVTTLGSDGAVLKQAGGALEMMKAYSVPVVDTVGAGDAFNAGLAFSLASGRELHEAVGFAAKVSGLAVTKFGAQDGMPTMAEVEAFETIG